MRKYLHLTLSLVLLFVASAANAWKFTVNSPAEGTVTELYQIILDEPAGTTFIDEFGAMPCTLKGSNGTEYTYNMGDDFQTHVTGTPLNSAEIVAPGTYTLTIPAGTFHIGGEGNEEQTFTWTIGGGEEQKSPYTLTYDKGAEFLKLTKEGCTSYEATYEGGASLEGFEGWFAFNPADPEWTFTGNTCIAAYVALADGEYTLKVQAGTYKFDGAPNEAFEIKFTIGEGTQGGGETGDFDGEKWQETIFKSGETSVTVPVTFATEGMTLATEGREFMGMTLDVNYNVAGENEIDWNNGTKLIITAKDNISGIVMKGNFLQFASADKGSYINGVWSGALMKGDVLTLTASDGIHVKEITVLYNGDEYKEEEGENTTGQITIAYPVANQLIASIANGGKLATFTTNKEYAQVIIDIDDADEDFNEIYKFPTRMVDNAGENSDNLHVGENTITASTPDGKAWNFFKGHTYTMTVRGYNNFWDLADNYDAIATVQFIGNGKDAEVLSDVTIDKIFPANGTVLPEGPRTVNITFSAPVKTLKAVKPEGMAGSKSYTCTKVDEEGLIWNIDLGSLSVESEEGGESAMTLEISGTDAADHVLNLGNNAARALQLQYTISKAATEPEEEIDVQVVPSFLAGEEEVALNDHSAVSVEKAEAIKVGFGDAAAKIKYATYSINELVEEEFMGVTDIVEIEVASGSLNLNAFGYAEFDPALKFPIGHKYNVSIKAWDSEDIFNEDFTIKDPVATFACEFNGSYDEESGEDAKVTLSPAFYAGEEEITLNDHSSVSVATADAIITRFGETPAVVKYATYSINELVEDEFMGVIDIVENEIVSGVFNLNNFGYSQFEETLKFPAGHKYNVKIKAWDSEDIFNADFTIKDPIATFECEFNGSYVDAVEGTMLVIKNSKGEILYQIKADENVQVEWIDAADLESADHK